MCQAKTFFYFVFEFIEISNCLQLTEWITIKRLWPTDRRLLFHFVNLTSNHSIHNIVLRGGKKENYTFQPQLPHHSLFIVVHIVYIRIDQLISFSLWIKYEPQNELPALPVLPVGKTTLWWSGKHNFFWYSLMWKWFLCYVFFLLAVVVYMCSTKVALRSGWCSDRDFFIC